MYRRDQGSTRQTIISQSVARGRGWIVLAVNRAGHRYGRADSRRACCWRAWNGRRTADIRAAAGWQIIAADVICVGDKANAGCHQLCGIGRIEAVGLNALQRSNGTGGVGLERA